MAAPLDKTDFVLYFCQVIYSQFGLAIHQNDHQARRRFVEWAQNEIAVGPDFRKRILFSDEAHFWLNGYVNKQKCRIWSEANPQVYVETPLHPEKLTVWCALWAGGIIDPYFFKNDEGHSVTVNGDRYRAVIANFFIPELNNPDVQEVWFQQDGATCHTARATIDLLKDTLGDRLISRFGPVNWPPRSCDLTPLDYFLWGYVKSLVYVDKPQTLDHLEDNIRRVIADIRPQMLEKVIENWTSRLDYIRASRGSHMPEVIFKMAFFSKKEPRRSLIRGPLRISYAIAKYVPFAVAARRLNVSRSVVHRLWNQYQTEVSVSRRHVPGRPRATTPAGDHFIAISARKKRRISVPQLVENHSVALGRRIFANTVRNRLHNSGLYARRPVVCVPLNRRQRGPAYLGQGNTFPEPDSNGLLYSTNESRFTLESDSGRLLIWRERSTSYHQSNTVERHIYRGGGIMVWAGISHSVITLICMCSREEF
ncbi:transposable element Tc3 transposase [Trichonephila clavipes]|nr:transposable element Tc3 transposase [Trichonephila clavipes]